MSTLKKYRIASVAPVKNANSKAVNVYNAAGQRFYVPERLAAQAVEGKYILVTEQTFTERRDESGELVACDPWVRETVTMIGDMNSVILAANEDSIIDRQSEAVITEAVTQLKTKVVLPEEWLAAIGI